MFRRWLKRRMYGQETGGKKEQEWYGVVHIDYNTSTKEGSLRTNLGGIEFFRADEIHLYRPFLVRADNNHITVEFDNAYVWIETIKGKTHLFAEED